MYTIVDHRAPWWMPHNAEPHLVTLQIFLFNLIALPSGSVLVWAMFIMGLWWVPIILVLFVAGVNLLFYKNVHSIPNSADDYHIKEAMRQIRSLYRQCPTPEMEKLLIDCYGKLNDRTAIDKRRELMQKYVQQTPQINKDPVVEEFETLLAVRRDMIDSGLL